MGQTARREGAVLTTLQDINLTKTDDGAGKVTTFVLCSSYSVLLFRGVVRGHVLWALSVGPDLRDRGSLPSVAGCGLGCGGPRVGCRGPSNFRGLWRLLFEWRELRKAFPSLLIRDWWLVPHA